MDLQDGRGDLSRDTPDVFLPCVSRLPPVSFYRLFTGKVQFCLAPTRCAGRLFALCSVSLELYRAPSVSHGQRSMRASSKSCETRACWLM